MVANVPPAKVRSQAEFPASSARRRVFVPLGLQQAVSRERAGLAHRAVDGRDDGARIGIHGPRALAQRAREEFIEARIGGRLAFHGVAHVRM